MMTINIQLLYSIIWDIYGQVVFYNNFFDFIFDKYFILLLL
jgi:hypothetical protein